MQDRPDALELLNAVRAFLEEQVVPALDGTRQFHARVAANVLAIVGRELTLGEGVLHAEWQRLGKLLGDESSPMPEGGAALLEAVGRRNEALAARIRAGDADGGSWGADVLTHLRATSIERLAIANPKYAAPRSRD